MLMWIDIDVSKCHYCWQFRDMNLCGINDNKKCDEVEACYYRQLQVARHEIKVLKKKNSRKRKSLKNRAKLIAILSAKNKELSEKLKNVEIK